MRQCGLWGEFWEVWKGCVWEDCDERTGEWCCILGQSLCLSRGALGDAQEESVLMQLYYWQLIWSHWWELARPTVNGLVMVPVEDNKVE